MLLGTAITQTFPRHPIAVVQQVQVLAQLAPGRFRLGLGTSGRSGMEQTYGANFRAPLRRGVAPGGAGRLGPTLVGCSPGRAVRGGRADVRRGHQREQSGMGWADAVGGKGRRSIYSSL